MAIKQIKSYRVTQYLDTGENLAWVTWTDGRGRAGTTSGNPRSTHMRELLARARRQEAEEAQEALRVHAGIRFSASE